MNLITFNKYKCKVFYLGYGNPHYQYKHDNVKIEHSAAEKDMGVDCKLVMSQQCALKTQQANCAWAVSKEA